MKLVDVYKAILRFAGLEADKDGYISVNLMGKKIPSVVNGYRLVLPTEERLHNANGEEQTVFHPLTENIQLGESDVIKYLKQCINVRLNLTAGHILQSLLTVVASPNLHGNLSPEQSEMLAQVKDADEKAVVNLVNIMVATASTRSDRLFTNIYLKRGGSYKGSKYSRVGIVGFPFYAELLAGKTETEFKLRKKDKEIFKDILEYVFTDIADPETYNYGSNSITAPFLEALLRSAVTLASRFNDLLALFSEHIEDFEKYHFDCSWIEAFDNIETLIQEIHRTPPQAGNAGSLPDKEEDIKPPYVNQYQPVPPAMVQVQPPEIKRSKKGVNFRSLVAANPALGSIPNALNNQLMTQALVESQRMYYGAAQSPMPYQVPNGYPPGYIPPPMMQPMPGPVPNGYPPGYIPPPMMQPMPGPIPNGYPPGYGPAPAPQPMPGPVPNGYPVTYYPGYVPGR